MFFQETTPDTSGYMIAGYAISFLVMALYVASIYLRNRNLQQDMKTLEEMEEAAPPVQAIPTKRPQQNTSTSANNKSAKPVTKRPRKV